MGKNNLEKFKLSSIKKKKMKKKRSSDPAIYTPAFTRSKSQSKIHQVENGQSASSANSGLDNFSLNEPIFEDQNDFNVINKGPNLIDNANSGGLHFEIENSLINQNSGFSDSANSQRSEAENDNIIINRDSNLDKPQLDKKLIKRVFRELSKLNSKVDVLRQVIKSF